MRLPFWLTLTIAAVVTALALGVAWAVLRPSGPPLTEAAFSLNRLSPNADGKDDIARLRYVLRRPANVSVYFMDAQGRRFHFRTDRPRLSGENEVDFSGIVDPFRLPDDTFTGDILARVLPNGEYTWHVEARAEDGESNAITGPLTITDADTALPELLNLSAPPAFSPNRDGIDDRAELNVYLSKTIDPDRLRMYLIGPDGAQIPIPEGSAVSDLGRAGLHKYDYDGGIDQGFNPPPGGAYTVRAEAEDRIGQRTAVSSTLTIRDSGLPRAEIARGELDLSAATVLIGQTLYFTVTIDNYGSAPIRTSGPLPGFVYPSMRDNYNTRGDYVQAGVFRVGLMCETCQNDYPWRWALGTPETLEMIVDSRGNRQYYLPPGQSAVVTGGIVLDQIVPARNPQYFWVGLIHEDVEIAAINNRVDPQQVTIVDPAQ